MIKIGIVGVGTVGESVVKILEENRDIITARAGKELKVVKGVVRDLAKPRKVNIPLTTDYKEVTRDPEIDIVVELMGGISGAYEVVKDALIHGKSVVTANKALLAYHRFELQQLARTPFEYEASVGGGIPIIKALREGLSANHILEIKGIINGTCNYILTKMEEGADFMEVLQEAQRLGYAEADPSFDISGLDAGHKLLILASIAYNIDAKPEDILIEGIEKLSPVDFRFAHQFGYKIKLLAIAKRVGEEIELRVHPTLIPSSKLLSQVNGVMNAVSVVGDRVGETLYYGAGAGGEPTASAVISDIIEIARGSSTPMLGYKRPLEIGNFRLRPVEEIESRYYLRFEVEDRLGILAQIGEIFSRNGVSIKSLIQRAEGEKVRLFLTTHRCRERQIRESMAQLKTAPFITAEPFLIRIEE
jgi:homoserine dehydrogenase